MKRSAKAKDAGPSRSVGAYEAKTHLSRLLDEVEKRGRSFLITRNGKQVAELRPPGRARLNAQASLARIVAIGEGATLGGISIRSLIDEGRRY